MRYLSPGNSCRLDWRLLWLWILCFVSPHLIAQNLGELLELQESDNQASQNDIIWAFTLIDGTEIVGRISNQDATNVDIKQLNGETRSIFIADIAERRRMDELKIVDGERWVSNPNRTRHLWSPSSMPLKKGESYLSQKELIFTSYAVGLTNNVAVLVGSMTPLLLAGGDGVNLIGGIKFATKLTSGFYLSGGGEMITFPGLGGLALPYLGFSVGEPDLQLSFNMGQPFAFDAESVAGDLEAMISICGMWRFAANLGFVSENIFLPGISTDDVGWGVLSLHGIAWRWIGKSVAFDLGFVMPGGVPLPIPWFDCTWHFK